MVKYPVGQGSAVAAHERNDAAAGRSGTRRPGPTSPTAEPCLPARTGVRGWAIITSTTGAPSGLGVHDLEESPEPRRQQVTVGNPEASMPLRAEPGVSANLSMAAGASSKTALASRNAPPARGMTTRELRHVRKLYGLDVSPELVSKVTDAVQDEIREWQTRPLGDVYAIVCLDAV